ncbi:hypothetical protein HP532_16660 [Pseudomonas sp. CrR25]|nr:hypothetical protein [Pseudomonas sp. CrR25]
MRIPLLLGCLYFSADPSQAAPLPTSESEQPPAQRRAAQLLISRDRDLPNACDVELHMTDQPSARLPADQSLRLKVPSGEFNLRVQLAPAEGCAAAGLASSRSILIGPGETQRYRVMLGAQTLFLAPQPDR